jgi:hypothetical protein
MLQTVRGDGALSRSSAFIWSEQCEDGHGVLQDDPRSRLPSTSRNADTYANGREMVTRDRQWGL